MSKNYEIEKFNKNRNILSNILFIISIIILVCFVLTLTLSGDDFNTLHMIAIVVFGVYTISFLILFSIFDIKRNKLIKKFYGEVKTEDKELARQLLSNIKLFDNCNLTFLEEEKYNDCAKLFKTTLKALCKGKYYYTKQSLECTESMLDELKKCDEKVIENNIGFVEYINKIHDLFEIYSIDL